MNKLGGQAPSVEQRRRREQVGRERAKAGADEQVRRTLEREHGDARERIKGAPQYQQRLSEKRVQLQRVQRERAGALARGDARRAAELGHRGQRIEGEIERQQAKLNGAQRVAGEGERALRRTGSPYTREQLQERKRFLDAQAALPAAREGARSGEGEPSGQRRDYAALAALAGYGRELALRRELADTARSVAAGGASPKLGRRERHKANREFDSTLRQRMRDDGRAMPNSRSSVMRDAHEVAARRKRQLGKDRR